MNSELQRNAWIELTPLRLWGVPLVMLVVFVAVDIEHSLTPSLAFAKGLSIAGFGMYVLFVIWGAIKATGCISNEVIAGTWDTQRLAAHNPTSLLVGKLIGSTIGEWYGAGFALALFVLGRTGEALAELPNFGLLGPAGATLFFDVLTLIGGALLLQAIALFGSLAVAHSVRSSRRALRPGTSNAAALLLALFLGSTLAPFAAQFMDSNLNSLGTVAWWFPLPMRVFLPASILMGLGWVYTGAHRLMRAELQEPVGPGPWLAFLAFMTFYLFPLTAGSLIDVGAGPLGRFLATGALVCGLLVQPLLLGERKDAMRLRGLLAAWRRRDRAAMLTQLPLWTFTLAAYTVCMAGLGLVAFAARTSEAWSALAFALALWLLMLRDIGLVLGLSLAPRNGRDPAMALGFFIVMFYMVLPIVANLAGGSTHWLLLMLYPFLVAMPESGVAGASAILAVGWALPLGLATWAFATPRIQPLLRAADD